MSDPRSQSGSAAIESPEFDASHFPECGNMTDEDAICTCDAIETDMREAFAAMTRGNF